MKKTVLIGTAALFVLCAVRLAAQTEFTPLVFAGEEGSYAIYEDTRFGETAYIGLALLGGNRLALRLYLAGSKAEVLVFHTFYTQGNALEPGTITPVRGDLMANDSTRRFLPAVYGWLDAWLLSRSRFDDMPEYEYGEEERISFQYWVPVLQMRAAETNGAETNGAGTRGAGTRLVTAGIMASATDPAFYAFAGEPEILVGPAVSLPPGEPGTAIMDGLSVPLDSNWRRGADGVYRIAGATGQDAYCMVEPLDMAEFGDSDTFDIIRLFILYSGGILLPDGLRIFVHDEYPCLFYRVWDAERKTVTVQYKLFVPRDGTFVSVVSLGAFESVYDGNRDYFDGILF